MSNDTEHYVPQTYPLWVAAAPRGTAPDRKPEIVVSRVIAWRYPANVIGGAPTVCTPEAQYRPDLGWVWCVGDTPDDARQMLTTHLYEAARHEQQAA